MANEDHLRILLQGVPVWNEWRKKSPDAAIDLRGATLYRADLAAANLSGADLRQAVLSETILRGATLNKADLRGATLRAATLDKADLAAANLSEATLVGTMLRAANLTGADFSRATLNGATLSETILKTAILKAAALYKADLSRADLTGADLSGATLEAATLSEATLEAVNLCGASLYKATLRETTLRGATLRGTYLDQATLLRADLTGTDLYGATLRKANLIEANLDGATLTEASLWESQRAGWSIHGIVCETAYWEKEGRNGQRTAYGPGEFERRYATHPKIVLQYDRGLSPFDIATLPAFIHQLETQHPGCALRLESVQTAAGGATVMLGIDKLQGRNQAERETLKRAIEAASHQVIVAQQALLKERGSIDQFLRELDHGYRQLLVQSMAHAGTTIIRK